MRKEKRTEKIKQKEMLLKFVSTKKWIKWNVLENTYSEVDKSVKSYQKN